jgi:hypothetical protein
MATDMLTCSICMREFSPAICFNDWTLQHGNNAAPVNTGKCCDICDETVVLPARIKAFGRSSKS